MSASELLDFFKIGVLSGEAEKIANTTKEAEWRRKLKCISTYCKKIMDERLSVLDTKQKKSVARRFQHTEIKFYSTDKVRTDNPDKKTEGDVTIDVEDLNDLIDMSLLSCYKCSQGECVKNCHLRELYHRISVIPVREEVKPGECEFTTNEVGEVKSINPQYRRVEE